MPDRLRQRTRIASVLLLLAVLGALCPGGWHVCLSGQGVQLVDAAHVNAHHHGATRCCTHDQTDAEADHDGDCTDLDVPVVNQPLSSDQPVLPAGVLLGELPLLLANHEPCRPFQTMAPTPGPPRICLRNVVLLI